MVQYVTGHTITKKSIALLCILTLSLTLGSLPANVYASGPYSDWQYMKVISVDDSKVSGTLSNFPVLINIVDPDLAAHAQTNGNDILFATSGGAQLAHEIESYDSLTGTLVAWVNVPSVSDSSGATIYMYYGNPSASNQQNPSGVWDSDYKGVFHMNDATSSSIVDSTSGVVGAKTGAGTPAQTTGQIANSQSNTAQNKITITDSDDWYFSSDFTIEVWVNFNSIQGGSGNYWKNAFVSQDVSSGIATKWMFCYDAVQGTKLEYVNPSASGSSQETHGNAWIATTGTWYDLVVTKSGNTISFYRNGAPDGTFTDTVPLPNVNNPLTMFYSEQTGNVYLNGKLDEIRISNGIARSADWIATAYNNQHSPSAFSTAGPEQANPTYTTVLPEYPMGALAAIGAVAVGFVVFKKHKSLSAPKSEA
jgi:MSHA biogenesis protein MshQ